MSTSASLPGLEAFTALTTRETCRSIRLERSFPRTITGIVTNIAVQSASNELGHYTIAQLQLGSYTVRVNAPGFKACVFSRFRRTFLQAGGGSSTIRFAGSRGNQSNWAIDGKGLPHERRARHDSALDGAERPALDALSCRAQYAINGHRWLDYPGRSGVAEAPRLPGDTAQFAVCRRERTETDAQYLIRQRMVEFGHCSIQAAV